MCKPFRQKSSGSTPMSRNLAEVASKSTSREIERSLKWFFLIPIIILIVIINFLWCELVILHFKLYMCSGFANEDFLKPKRVKKDCGKVYRDVSKCSSPSGFSFCTWVCSLWSRKKFDFGVLEYLALNKNWPLMRAFLDRMGRNKIEIYGKEMNCWSNGDENHLRISTFSANQQW